MQRSKSIIIGTVVLLFLCSFVMAVSAVNPEGSLASGYAVTNNYHGMDVPSGTSVTVTAMTTDGSVDMITFIWKNPAGQIVFTETKRVWTNGTTYNNKLVRFAQSTFEPNAIGDWGVQAKFLDVHRFCIWTWTERVARRATSFNVIPEVPIIGTAGASVAMVLGFTYKIRKKPEK